jgi:serine/threonine-protein kinase
VIVSLPERLGKYEIRRALGEGGMGVVYEGFDPQIMRRVAIKAIRRELMADAGSGEVLIRLQREAQAAGRLNHPRIVTVYEYGEDVTISADGRELRTPFIAMEFVEGRDLKSLLDRKERLSLAQIQRLMGELLEALGYSHANGVVHRDIKPGNILLLADGSIKVADFGIARLESSSTLTVHGSVMGSPHYMAPEQLLGEAVDGRTDLYAAGVVLYELLTGERPFTGSSLTAITTKALREQAIEPSALSMTVPKAYDVLMARALAKRPDERFQSAQEFRQALFAIQPAAAGRSELDATVARTLAPPAAPVAATRIRAGGWAGQRSLLIGVAAAVLLALTAGIATLMPQQPASQASAVQSQAAASQLQRQSASQSQEGVQRVPVVEAPEPGTPVLPGVATITAVGLAASGAQSDPQQLAAVADQVRADARQRLVAKAAALYVDPASLSKHYAVLREQLFSHGGNFIKTLISEPAAPQPGANGVMFETLRASVDVRAVRRRLNEVADERRIELTRNDGNPRVSVLIRTQDGTGAAERSELAENILKERIRSYGFILVDESAPADFRVEGTAGLRTLSARLPASGLLIEKFVLAFWTLRASDAKTGEQIYFNTRIPGKQSWASRELALQDVGKLVGDELSRSLFLRHFDYLPQHVVLHVDGLPAAASAALLPGLDAAWLVLDAVPQPGSDGNSVFAVDLSGGSQELPELLQRAVIGPLNQRLQRACFAMTQSDATQVRIKLDPACSDGATLARLKAPPLESDWGGSASAGSRQARTNPGLPGVAAIALPTSMLHVERLVERFLPGDTLQLTLLAEGRGEVRMTAAP